MTTAVTGKWEGASSRIKPRVFDAKLVREQASQIIYEFSHSTHFLSNIQNRKRVEEIIKLLDLSYIREFCRLQDQLKEILDKFPTSEKIKRLANQRKRIRKKVGEILDQIRSIPVGGANREMIESIELARDRLNGLHENFKTEDDIRQINELSQFIIAKTSNGNRNERSVSSHNREMTLVRDSRMDRGPFPEEDRDLMQRDSSYRHDRHESHMHPPEIEPRVIYAENEFDNIMSRAKRAELANPNGSLVQMRYDLIHALEILEELTPIEKQKVEGYIYYLSMRLREFNRQIDFERMDYGLRDINRLLNYGRCDFTTKTALENHLKCLYGFKRKYNKDVTSKRIRKIFGPDHSIKLLRLRIDGKIRTIIARNES
jgi:hypothetical protein